MTTLDAAELARLRARISRTIKLADESLRASKEACSPRNIVTVFAPPTIVANSKASYLSKRMATDEKIELAKNKMTYMSVNTLRAYSSDCLAFANWAEDYVCDYHEVAEKTISNYLCFLYEYKKLSLSSLRRKRSALLFAYARIGIILDVDKVWIPYRATNRNQAYRAFE